jgi:hypothetical protein
MTSQIGALTGLLFTCQTPIGGHIGPRLTSGICARSWFMNQVQIRLGKRTEL